MKTKKDELKQTLISLDLGIAPEDIDPRLEKLNDKEIEMLLTRTKILQEYLVKINNKVYETDPEKHKELNGEYEREMETIEDEYAQKMEDIDQDSAEKIDIIGKEQAKELNTVLEEEQQMLQNITSLSQKMSDKMTKAV